MSVINRMLQELESRHEQPQHRLPGFVRAVPPPARADRRVLWLALALLGAAALGGFGFWVWQSNVSRPAVSVATHVPATPSAAAVRQPDPMPSAGWPQPLQAPTERLVAETALAPRPSARPAYKPAEPAYVVKSMPVEKAQTQPAPAESVVVKSAPNSTPESGALPDIKQVSPAQRADQRYREALVLISQGRMGEAQSTLEDALKIDARHLGARQALLGILVDGRRLAQAEQLLQDGLSLNIAPATLAMALARLQVEGGDQAAALATLDRYLPQGRGNADYQSFLAALLQRAGRHGEAIEHYQAALRSQPNRAVWWMGLGISMQADKRLAEAEQAFVRARTNPGLSPELQAFVDQRLKQLQASH